MQQETVDGVEGAEEPLVPEDDPVFTAPLKPTFASVCARLGLFHSVIEGAPTLLPDYFAAELARDAALLAIRLSHLGFRFPPIVPYPEDPVGHFEDISQYLGKIALHVPEKDFKN